MSFSGRRRSESSLWHRKSHAGCEYGSQAGWYYFVNDHLGTPHRIVSESGEIVWAAAYLPFGEAQVVRETVANSFRFPGQYFDAETGLHYNWHRYYDPQTGRYLTPDPIGLAGGVNLYAYVEGNPVTLADPYGLDGGVITIPAAVYAFVKAAVFVGSSVIVADLVSRWMGSDDGGDAKTPCEPENSSPSPPGTDPDDDDNDSKIAEHSQERGHFKGKTTEEIKEIIKDIRENGTPHKAGNGKILTRWKRNVLIDDPFGDHKGTVFVRPKGENMTNYIEKFLKMNR